MSNTSKIWFRVFKPTSGSTCANCSGTQQPIEHQQEDQQQSATIDWKQRDVLLHLLVNGPLCPILNQRFDTMKAVVFCDYGLHNTDWWARMARDCWPRSHRIKLYRPSFAQFDFTYSYFVDKMCSFWDIVIKKMSLTNLNSKSEETFSSKSRKVAPEGLPWVLLYEVKGRAASPVTWLFRRLLVILVPPPHPPASHAP